MRRRRPMLFAILFLLSSLPLHAEQTQPTIRERTEISVELGRAYGEHQALRQTLEALRIQKRPEQEIRESGLYERILESDRGNAELLKRVLDQFGWPTISRFGANADSQAWIFALYAGHDSALQERSLSLIERALLDQDTRPANFAFLWDRVHLNRGEKQKFGTQGKCIEKGHWEPDPVENPAQINERRQKFGIGTFETYVDLKSRLCRSADIE